jgi:hypothetical protein
VRAQKKEIPAAKTNDADTQNQALRNTAERWYSQMIRQLKDRQITDKGEKNDKQS